MTSFRLYPVEQHWFSFADYGAVLSVMQRLAPKRVLEFGPGSSTLALIEGGAQYIDACEDDWGWADTYRARLEDRFPLTVKIRQYLWTEPVYVSGVTAQHYDLALIDGPENIDRRPEVVRYALERCAHVLVALEESEGRSLRAAVDILARRHQRPVEIMDTGPLAGAFALIGPAC